MLSLKSLLLGTLGVTDEKIGGGSYPRGLSLADGTTLVCAAMNIYANKSKGFERRGLVHQRPGGHTDLGNCNLIQLQSGRVLASYRHHTGCSEESTTNYNGIYHRSSVNTCQNYSIQVSFSDDAGASWEMLSTVIESGIGMWEPFLFQLAPEKLVVAYSQELTNGGLQSIVWQASSDEGKSWEPPVIISDGSEHHSRDGMPGIARFVDGSLGLVFEGFWASGKWGHFSVQMRRSFNNGLTWNNGTVIYAAGAQNAGAPQISVSPTDGAAFISFMTDEDSPAKWPTDASAKAVFSSAQAGTGGTPVDFFQKKRLTVCHGPECMWPGLFNARNSTFYVYEHGGSSFVHKIS